MDVGVGSTRRTLVGRAAEAAIELGRDDSLHDLLDALGHQPNHEVDSPPFVTAVVARLHPGELVLDAAFHSLAHQPHDGIDDVLFVEVAAAAIVMRVAVVVIITVMIAMCIVVAVAIAVSITVAVAAAVVAISTVVGPRPGEALEGLQSFEKFTKIVVAHWSLHGRRTLVDAGRANTFSPRRRPPRPRRRPSSCVV